MAYLLILTCGILLFLRYPGNPASYRNNLPGDFAVYVKAWEWCKAGQNPYMLELRHLSPFKYSPGVLWLIGKLPENPSHAWFFFSTLCIASLMGALVTGASYRSWRRVGLLLVGFFLSWKGILETLDYGQLELLILGVAVGAAALVRRYPVYAGFLAGTLPWFKLPWVVLGWPLLLACRDKKRRMMISGYLLAYFIWGAAIPSLAFGPERAKILFQTWIEVLRNQPHELYFSDINQSVWVTLERWMGSRPELAIGLGCVLMGWVLVRLSVRVKECLKFQYARGVFSWVAPWLILIQLLNPLSWRWGSALIVGVPFAFSWPSEGWGGRGIATFYRLILLVIVAILWLLQLNPVVQSLGFHHWSELHSYGVVTGYWVALLLLCL